MRRLLVVACVLPLLAGCGGGGAPVAPVRMVTVRLVTQTTVLNGYEALVRSGLLVAVRNPFTVASLCSPIARDQAPRSGRRVPAGSVVTVSAGFCPLGSPAVTGASARVPAFVGRPVSDAVAWAERQGLFWEARDLPPLPASGRRRLLDNYVVVRQQPPPGARLRQGVKVGRGFRPTPLVLHAEPRPGGR